ncbi:MAG: DUF885 family protein [Erysipelotrichaceae bacterium]|nr:DUF885 family protein [Erysipelotrichaceae bacterium]
MKKLIILFISLMLLLSGCSRIKVEPTLSESESFDKFTHQLFIDTMSENYADCHFTLKNPDAYGITFKTIDFGKLIHGLDYSQYLEELKTFKRSRLSEQQQLTYDVLSENLKHSVALDDAKYEYLWNPCDPLMSVTSNLSTMLIEFPFYKEEDIDDYISLANATGDLTDQINDYLKAQSEKGLLMPKSVAKDYIDTIDSFVDQEADPLVRVFNNYKFPFELSAEAKADYAVQIDEAYRQSVCPAFNSVKKTVKDLLSKSKNQKGLYYLKNGKEYYQAYVQSILGNDMSIRDIESLMKKRLSHISGDLSSVTRKNFTTILDYEGNDIDTGLKSYKAILKYLKKQSKKDFPDIGKIDYQVTDMDLTNAKSGNSAYYLTPPIDDVSENVIRVNTTSSYVEVDSVDTFITLAHEGYPGHLYQTNYALKQELPEILNLFECLGYTEGYATFVQYKAYDYLPKVKDAMKDYLRLQDEYAYSLIILCDIGIHYKGWSENDLRNYLRKYGYESVAPYWYDQLLGSPAVFVSYHVGCTLLENYQTTMKKKLGKKYNDQLYYKTILAYGSLPFSVLKSRVEDAIKKKK